MIIRKKYHNKVNLWLPNNFFFDLSVHKKQQKKFYIFNDLLTREFFPFF